MTTRPNPAPALAMQPLLSSIATEISERSLAVLELEARLEKLRAARTDPRELRVLAARLAHQKRELRLATEELERLGWKRDGARPLRFFYGEDVQREVSWQPENTGFFRALDPSLLTL